MEVIKFCELIGHDVYEFSYAHNYKLLEENHWSEDSIYVSDEDFNFLSKYIDIVVKNFNYYGLNKVKFNQWEKIKNIALDSQIKNDNYFEINKFFNDIDIWKKSNFQDLDYFWIWGL